MTYNLLHNKKDTVVPVDFLETFYDMDFKIQRDVYEFFNEFLNNIEDSLKQNGSSAEPLNSEIKGQFLNELRFIKCGHTMVMNREDFIVLSLEIREMGNIEQSLDCFSHWEFLQANDATCPQCGEKGGREKRTHIIKLPDQLIIHLKRFQFESGRFIKVNEGFHFGNELNVGVKQVEDEKAGLKMEGFELDGVILHVGSVEYGHYMSLVRKELGEGGRAQHCRNGRFIKGQYSSRVSCLELDLGFVVTWILVSKGFLGERVIIK